MEAVARHITPKLQEAFKVNPIVFLNGPRQAGKSTLVQNLAPTLASNGVPATYLTLDRSVYLASATSAPESFLTSYSTPLIIDEVQLATELFRVLKILADEARAKDKATANGRYLLTGSANIMALPKLADPLVGRMAVLTLYPFSAAEVAKTNPVGLDRMLRLDFSHLTDRGQKLIEVIKSATYPEIFLASAAQRQIWFDSYITTILQRDVRQIVDIEKFSLLPHLLRILATRVGGLINDSDIAREAGLNSVTAKTYREILKLMFLTFDVKPWYRNAGKRLVKSAKGYFVDTNLIAHLLDYGMDTPERTRPDIDGHLIENFVASELLKQISSSNTKANLYHFRTSDGKEVDFVLEQPDGRVLAIEVKRSESVSIADFKGIKVFQEIAGPDFIGGVVLHTGREVAPFGPGLWAVPIFVLWQ